MTGALVTSERVASSRRARRAKCRPSCRGDSSRGRPLRRTARARRAAGDVGPRVGPVERIGVRERHVAGAHLVKLAQDGDRAFDRVAPSMPISEAILPVFAIRSISSAVRASSNVSGTGRSSL